MTLLLVLVLLPRPSLAGQWVVTFTGSSTAPPSTNASSTFAGSQITSTAPTILRITPGSCQVGYSAQGPLTLSVTATLTWFRGPGDTSTPPPTLSILEYGTAQAVYVPAPPPYGASSFTPSSISDGLSDPLTSAPSGDYGQSSSGGHLMQMAISPGQLSVTLSQRTLTAGASWSPSVYLGGIPTNGPAQGTGTFVDYGVSIDSRMVAISSSLGQTSHKSTIHFDSNGVALPDPDVPASDGTTSATSVKPDPTVDELITYYATPAGSWAANSSYLWHINEGSPYLSSSGGNFTLPSNITYAALYSLSSTMGGPEHVYIHLTDAVDSANATNNYYIAWHDPGENWQNKGSKVEISPKLFGTSDSAQPANGYDNVKIAPDEVDWSTASHIGGGIVTTGVGVLAVAQPETSPFVIGFLTAAGYSLSLTTPPDPTIYTPQGTLAQFTADVNTQVQINNKNTASVFMPGAQRVPPTLATKIADSGDYKDYFTGLLGPGFHFSVQVYRHRFTQNRVGDGYGAQGYNGQVSGSLSTSGSLEYVYNWN